MYSGRLKGRKSFFGITRLTHLCTTRVAALKMKLLFITCVEGNILKQSWCSWCRYIYYHHEGARWPQYLLFAPENKPWLPQQKIYVAEWRSHDSCDPNSPLAPRRPIFIERSPFSCCTASFLRSCIRRLGGLHPYRWTLVDVKRYRVCDGVGIHRVEIFTRSRVFLFCARHDSPWSRRDRLIKCVNTWSAWLSDHLSRLALFYLVLNDVAASNRS